MEPYLGEIKLMAFRRDLQYWLPCDGRSLPVNQYQALYSVLGTYFGGSTTNFNIPDLRGRVPACFNYTASTDPKFTPVGRTAGSETITLTATQIPPHNHPAYAVSSVANVNALAGNLLSSAVAGCPAAPYGPPSVPMVPIYPNTVEQVGDGGAHPNMQPYQVLCYYIATMGVYPPH
jgi:microcystin-dependent protein